MRSETEALLTLDDNGPGIPLDEIGMVTRRFFRGRHKSVLGSGLGLAIAETALEKDGLSLRLENRTVEPGLRAQIVIDPLRVSPPRGERRPYQRPGRTATAPS
jgi:two-component system sensor histidine kinase QseC